MVQICLGVYPVHLASVAVDGREVVFPFLVSHVHGALVGKQHCVSSVACGHHTVKHIHASLYGLQQILWCAHSHQVAWLVGGQNLVHHLNHFIHQMRGFAHRQSSYGIALGILLCHMLCRFLPQLFEGAALHNGKQCLMVAIQG